MNALFDSCWDARLHSSEPETANTHAAGNGLDAALARIEPWLGKAGVSRVAVVTGLDVVGIPVVMVVRPEGRSLSVAQGKGPTLSQAKLSGLMEALEHFHAESADLPLRYASLRELRESAKNVVNPSQLSRTTRELNEDTPLLWASGKSMFDSEECYVPYELVHLDYRLPLPSGSGYFHGSSTGLGGGFDLERAQRSALLEVVERHEMTTFFQLSPAAQHARRVDLGGVRDGICCELLDRFAHAGVSVSVWDLASENLAVPCYFCEVVDSRRDWSRTLGSGSGFGCDVDAPVALERALCEAAQGRLTAIAGTRDDISTHALQAGRSAAAYAEAKARSSVDQKPTHFCETLRKPNVDPAAASSDLLQRLRREGYGPPVLVDLSKPGWPVHVVRVVAPGLLNATHAFEGSTP